MTPLKNVTGFNSIIGVMVIDDPPYNGGEMSSARVLRLYGGTLKGGSVS